ncbi:MAG: hypothetical protein KGY61_05470 [Desulfobacterales bacterium]|nr:hypothetical protein [Desulfobacterales bacterium]
MQRDSKILIGLTIVLCLGVGGFAVYKGLTAHDFLAPRIERELENRLQARVEAQGVEFGLLFGARIAQLRLTPTPIGAQAPEKAPLVLTDILIRHELLPLLFGQYRPAKVVIGDLRAGLGLEVIQWLSDIRKNFKKSDVQPGIQVTDATMEIDLPALDRPVQVKDFHFALWPETDGKQVHGTSNFDFGGNAVQLEFKAIPEQAQVETQFSIQKFDLSALPVIGKGKTAFDPAELEMAGEISGTLFVQTPTGKNGRPNINGELTISGLSANYPKLPFSLEDGFAKLSFTENAVAIRDGAFNCARGGIEIPAACLRFDDYCLECAWIRVNVSRLEVPLIADKQTLAFLPVKFRPEFDVGTATGSVHLQWTPSGGLKYGGDMMIDDVAGSLPKLDTEFSELDASISFSESPRLVIRQARARVLGGRAEAVGTCEFEKGKIRNPAVEFWLNDVTETDKLVNLLPVVVRDFIKKAGFTKPEVDGCIALQPEHMQIDLSINGDAANLPDLPIQVDEPHLEVKWKSDIRQVRFENVRAKIDGSPLEGSGTLNFGQNMRLDASLLGRRLPLNSRLLKWCGLQLGDWRVGGTYDLDLRADKWWPAGTKAAEFLRHMRVQVNLQDAVISHPETGKLAESINGHISLDSEGLHLSNMTGDLCGFGFRGSGRLPFAKDPRPLYFQIESENMTLGPKLYDRLPFDIGLEAIGLNGQCELKAELQGLGKGPLSGNITTILHHVGITPGQTEISGSGTARFRITAENGWDPTVEGTINLDDVAYGDLDGERLTADFVYNSQQLDIPEININAYGGKIRLAETEMDTGSGTWETKAHVAHLELESLMGAYGVEGRDTPSGVMRGDIRLAGRHMDPKTFSGEGTIKISRGRLYSFPLLVSVFNVLDLKMPRWSPVTDAYGDFTIDKGRLMFKDLLFAGGSVPVHMEGSVSLGAEGDLKQKPINFIVTVAKQEGILDQIPLVNWAKRYTVDYLRQLVLQARVKGTFDDYEIKTLSSPVMGPIRKMFYLLEKITPATPGKG